MILINMHLNLLKSSSMNFIYIEDCSLNIFFQKQILKVYLVTIKWALLK